MFDTHAHLNFKVFEKNLDGVIEDSRRAGVEKIVVPGTDIKSSRHAIEIAEKYEDVYAAVGIHPHHVYKIYKETRGKNQSASSNKINTTIQALKNSLKGTHDRMKLLKKKIVAIGEIGLDRHIYQKTKYGEYNIDDKFMALQRDFFVRQLELAKEQKLSVIIHNREAKDDLLQVLGDHWDAYYSGRMVFHCCEPEPELLDFAKKHQIYIGADGDITYRRDKQEFVKNVPLELLVVETDSPFLTPEPIKSKQKYPNTPDNLSIVVQTVAHSKGIVQEDVRKTTAKNGMGLFEIN